MTICSIDEHIQKHLVAAQHCILIYENVGNIPYHAHLAAINEGVTTKIIQLSYKIISGIIDLNLKLFCLKSNFVLFTWMQFARNLEQVKIELSFHP